MIESIANEQMQSFLSATRAISFQQRQAPKQAGVEERSEPLSGANRNEELAAEGRA